MSKLYMTERWLRTLKPPEKARVEYRDTNVVGLTLRVTSKGKKTWSVVYKIPPDRGWRRWTIGPYPAFPLAEARTKAKEALLAAERGEDVAQQHRAKREAPTFGYLVKEYLACYASKKRSGHSDKLILNKDPLPKWKKWKAHDVKRHDVKTMLNEIVERGAPIRANRCLATVRKLFNWAIEEDLVETNPCWGIKRPSKENKRDRVLSTDEIKSLWEGLDEAPLDLETRIALKLILVTAQRPGEVLSLERHEIADGWWTIPAEKAKNGLSHRVPLSPLAEELIAQIPEPDKKDDEDAGEHDYLLRSPLPGQRIQTGSLSKALRRNDELFGIAHFTPHDLRRTAASHMTGAGISRLLVSKILNHAEQGITAVYDRHSYDAEKQRALEKWGRLLSGVVSGEQQKVVPLRAENTG